MMPDPYDRQRRLSEVGDDGQARLALSRARVPAGPGAETELTYLVRAGVGGVAVARGVERVFEHAPNFLFAGPRAVAQGAHGALVHVLGALSRAR